MPKRYPVEFRRGASALIRSGRRVVQGAVELGVSEQAIYWRSHEQIDPGGRTGLRLPLK